MGKRKTIVITGASGFLGSHLVERLKNDGGYKVYALSSRSNELREKLGGTSVEYLHKDALKEYGGILEEAIVINCAYPRNSAGTAVADGLRYIQEVFEAAVENQAAAIINISSQSVYSMHRTEAASEETPVCPESLYAVGKYAVELMLESICRGSGTRYTSLRMASLIGPGFDQRIVNRLVKQALETGEMTVMKNKQKFGYLDVEDAVSGIVTMLLSDTNHWRTVYNLGREGACTLVEIAEAIQSKLSACKPVRLITEEDNNGNSSELNACAFCKDFSFTPHMDIYDSIEAIIKSDESE